MSFLEGEKRRKKPDAKVVSGCKSVFIHSGSKKKKLKKLANRFGAGNMEEEN